MRVFQSTCTEKAITSIEYRVSQTITEDNFNPELRAEWQKKTKPERTKAIFYIS